MVNTTAKWCACISEKSLPVIGFFLLVSVYSCNVLYQYYASGIHFDH
jgi:hypothetical protein